MWRPLFFTSRVACPVAGKMLLRCALVGGVWSGFPLGTAEGERRCAVSFLWSVVLGALFPTFGPASRASRCLCKFDRSTLARHYQFHCFSHPRHKHHSCNSILDDLSSAVRLEDWHPSPRNSHSCSSYPLLGNGHLSSYHNISEAHPRHQTHSIFAAFHSYLLQVQISLEKSKELIRNLPSDILVLVCDGNDERWLPISFDRVFTNRFNTLTLESNTFHVTLALCRSLT